MALKIKQGAELASKFFDTTLIVLSFISGLLLVFITFSIGYAILSRLLNLPSLIWVVQFNEYALLWVTFLGTAWVLKNDQHTSIDILTRFLGGKTMAVLKCLHGVLGMGLCSILTWYGALTVIDQFQRGTIDVKAIDIPMYLILFVIPLGFFLLFIQFLRNLFHAIVELKGHA